RRDGRARDHAVARAPALALRVLPPPLLPLLPLSLRHLPHFLLRNVPRATTTYPLTRRPYSVRRTEVKPVFANQMRRPSGRLARMNFIDDVMEPMPASRLGIIAVDPWGHRREWHFGELIARSAGLSGAMAARGVERGDVVMTLIGS